MTHYNNSSNNLKIKVMRRVYGIWFMKKVMPWLALEFMIAWFSIYYIKMHVSIGTVMHNIATHYSWNPVYYAKYFTGAFITTESMVQLALIGMLVFFIIFFREFVRNAKRRGFMSSRNILRA